MFIQLGTFQLEENLFACFEKERLSTLRAHLIQRRILVFQTKVALRMSSHIRSSYFGVGEAINILTVFRGADLHKPTSFEFQAQQAAGRVIWDAHIPLLNPEACLASDIGQRCEKFE